MKKFLTKEQENLSYERWKKEKLTASLSMNFAGHIQCAESPEKIQAKLKRIESFLAGKGSAPLQDSSVEALPQAHTPAEEDFIDVTYRALSASMLADRPVDFSNEPMLKRATKLLDGQTVFKDHQTSVDNWVGRVAATNWDTETKGIPPGINAVLRLDTIKDPMAVRGVLQGALHSASVTVSFEWKPSHPKLMEDNTFFQNLGEQVDGQTVRVIVTKIEKFWEISLVWQGADAFAKQIGEDGKPVQQAAELDDTQDLSLKQVQENQPKQEEEMKLLAILEKVLKAEVTEENLEELLGKYGNEYHQLGLEKSQAVLTQKEEGLKAATTELESLRSKVAELAPQAELGKKYLEEERKEAIRFYNLSKGDKASPVILKTLQEASLEVAQAWKEDLKSEFEAKVPNSCQKCGSTEVQRKASVEGAAPSDAEKPAVLLSETAQKAVNSIHN